MKNKNVEQIAQDLAEQVPSDKGVLLMIIDDETKNAAFIIERMSELHLLATLVQIYKTISPLGRDCAKIAIKNMDCKTDSQKSESLKINLN